MYHTFNFTHRYTDYVFDDNYAFLWYGGCRLRRHDDNDEYTPLGEFTETIVEFPNIEGTAVREFTGVSVEGIIPDGTAIGYQASTDDGSTWEWFDGASWLPAGASDWSTATQLDEGVGILGGRQLKLRMRLTPDTDLNVTPHVYRVHVFYEAVWGYFEDLKRSIKHYIDDNAVNHLVYSKQLGSASTTLTLDNIWQVIAVAEVYNITDDPGRLTNLYQSYDSGTRTITMTGSVAADKIVEVRYTGRCNVFLAADEDLQISEVPAIVVVLPRAREDKYAPKNLFEYEPLSGRGIIRRRERLIPISSTIMLYAVSSTEVEGLAIQDALAELFEPEPVFRSVAVGEDFFCLTYEPLIDNDMVSTGLHVKATQILVLGNKDLRSYTDLQPVTTINEMYVGAKQMGEPTDPVSANSHLAPLQYTNPVCEALPPEGGEIEE